MIIGNTEITRKDMPSFVDFQSNPYRVYTSMQDVLAKSLQVNALANPQLMNANAPASKENNKGWNA